MGKSKKIQYAIIWLLAMLLAMGNVVLASHKLMLYIENESYLVNGRDILNIIFMTDEFNKYPYIDKSDMGIFLPVFSVYIVGIIISSLSFLTKSGSYYCMTYSRVGSKKKAVIYMKRNSLQKICIYVTGYSVTCLIGMYYCMERYFSKSFISYSELVGEMILHGIAAILLLLLIQRIILFSYIKLNGTFAFIIGLIAIMSVLILDIQLKNLNIILFSPIHFYFDSIGILSAGNLLFYLVGNKFLYKQLPYEGGIGI